MYLILQILLATSVTATLNSHQHINTTHRFHRSHSAQRALPIIPLESQGIYRRRRPSTTCPINRPYFRENHIQSPVNNSSSSDSDDDNERRHRKLLGKLIVIILTLN